MKDGTTFCLFKTKQEIMSKEEKQNIISNFLSGWQKLFGGAKEHTTPKAKPFPKNHFYSPEELEYLSQNKEGSLIDQWAVSIGKWAFEQGKDKSSPTKFAAVKWQNGLMATWIDGKLTPDTKDRQIGRLLLLKERGYELPERYENMAQDYEAQSLVGKYFVSNNDKSIIKIDSYDRGSLIFDAPSLVLKKWEDGSLSSNEEKVAYADFHKSLNEKYTIMEEERQKEFQEKLANFEDGKELYKGMHNLLRQTYPPTIGGSIPMELRTAHPVGFFDGKVIPVSWSLTSEKDIKVSVYTNHSNALSSITINEDNAYKAKSLLNSIAHAINNEKVNGLTRSLVNVLGNKLGEDKIFAKENNTPLLEAREGTVNAVTATNDGRVIAFNLNTHKEIPLHGKESVELMQALLFEGLDEQSRLRKELSIPKMKDYVESMEDEEDILSGNKELLPHGSKVDSLYGTYYSAEEEYSSYAQGTLPLAAEDKAEFIADLQSSFMNFKQELQNMVEAYKDHDGVIDTNKVSKLEKLDRILNIEARGQTPVKPVPVAAKRESPKESLQDAEAASKQNDLKEVKNINANEINISPRGRQHKELRTPDGKLLGFTYQGKIYLYPEAKGFEPPVHEYTHLWAEALQDRNWKEWKNVVGMMKKSNLWNEVRDLHTELIATDDIAEEVLATYSGRRGAERLESKLKEIVASNKSMDEKTAETQAVTQMNNAVSKFWNVMSDFLHIHYTSAEEVADRVLYEYTKGLYPLNYEEVAQQKGKTKPYYVSVEEKDNGRWHRPEVEQRAAYQRYGEMMADKLSLQLTYGDMPWIKSDKQVPCDLSKKAYQGMDSFMLALDAEKNAYTLPIYISKEDIQANNLLVKSDATFFPIIEEVGVTELYNIEQTNYPILHPKDYEELKLDSIASNRYKQSNELGQLLRKGAWQTAIAFDGKPSLASYSANNDTIHVAPVQHYEKEQDFYRDLGMGLTRSTRKAEARKTSFESLSREELVSLVGSVILGQKNHFDVTTPQQTSMWKERLRKDPSYTKQVLSSADVASQIIIQRIDILKKGGSQDIDLRSSTPVEVDIDGNGIVESQENLAPDQKQSSNESQEQSDEVPRQEKRHLHR